MSAHLPRPLGLAVAAAALLVAAWDSRARGQTVTGVASATGTAAGTATGGVAVGAVPGAAVSGPLVYPPVAVFGVSYGYPYRPVPVLLVPLRREGPPPPPEAAIPGIIEVAPPAPPVPVRPAVRPIPRDTERARHLITLGDRLFRGGNLVKAVERYEQALQASPAAAAPRVRLAQVAISRGDYGEAAARFREAQLAEPGWIAAADDIQGVWAEPRRFAAMLAKIESHLHIHPDDRDAWFVLGAQLHLSGRTAPAADIFLRLTDRPPDAALAAFLAAGR